MFIREESNALCWSSMSNSYASPSIVECLNCFCAKCEIRNKLPTFAPFFFRQVTLGFVGEAVGSQVAAAALCLDGLPLQFFSLA